MHGMAGLSLRPLTVVGLEGALGCCVILGAVLPLAQRLPGPAGRASVAWACLADSLPLPLHDHTALCMQCPVGVWTHGPALVSLLAGG